MDSNLIIIFGASGDLTKRKLIPALNNLYSKENGEQSFSVLGIGRTKYSANEYRKYINDGNNFDSSGFLERINYLTMDPSDSGDYSLLISALADYKCSNYLFYLATPPSMYEIISLNIKKSGLHLESPVQSGIKPGKRKIIIEKPFGYDLESAIRMNRILKEVFSENQIFRIDHYLGKETVQNILALRFANTVFEPIWNRHHIDRVEITAVEDMGIESRGGFYDGVGALRDMVQNHLIQLLAIIAMEPPVMFNENEFRDEVVKVYKSLKPINSAEINNSVVRGQYISGEKRGVIAKGYRDEKGVDPESQTETFLAMKLFISNWRWEGVPFYIRTGKQMPTKVTEIIIHFKQTPHKLFSSRQNSPEHNQLIIRIQPNEGMILNLDMKVPGKGFDIKQAPMEFSYELLGKLDSSDPYSRLLEDALKGEVTLFTRSDAVEASWSYFDPVLSFWSNDGNTPLYGYPAGSWGPLESEEIIEDNLKWTNPCKNLTNTNVYCEL